LVLVIDRNAHKTGKLIVSIHHAADTIDTLEVELSDDVVLNRPAAEDSPKNFAGVS
jgi:hypothetical protein